MRDRGTNLDYDASIAPRVSPVSAFLVEGGAMDGDRIPLGTADCHSSARALTWYEHEADVIALCRHCEAKHSKALNAAGWQRLRIDLDVLQNAAPV